MQAAGALPHLALDPVAVAVHMALVADHEEAPSLYHSRARTKCGALYLSLCLQPAHFHPAGTLAEMR